MKYLTTLTLVALLAGCSSNSTAPVSSEAAVMPAEAPGPSLSTDAPTASDLPAPAGSENLATPVEPAPMPQAPGTSSASNSADNLTPATPPAAESPAASSSSGTQQASEAQLSEPTSSLPPPVSMPAPGTYGDEKQKAAPPIVAAPGAGTNANRNNREEYREYQDRVKARNEAETAFDQRALFPHEDGAFQMGFDFIYKPFGDYDFDPGQGVHTFASKGAALDFNYFPLRSLSYGRLGVGVQGGIYWTTYDIALNAFQSDSSTKHSIDTYGVKAIYEFQYILGQTIVPFAFLGYDKVHIKQFSLLAAGVNYPSTSFNSTNYGAGLHLNLNRIEPSAASKALASTGVRKFYLTYTFQQRAENTGAAHYLGLRFEY